MFQRAILIAVISIVTLLSASNSFAQTNPNSNGPCLLGVGNCPHGNGGNQPGSIDTGRGTRYYDGQIAREIINARNYGSRYLLVLNRSWDYDCKCYVEERAWVSEIRGTTNDGRVAVVIGRSVKVYLNNALSVQQVNQAEAYHQYSRNEIYKWLKYQEQVAPYYNDPTYYQWARQEYAKAQAWIDHYKKYIATTQAQLAASAPQ